MALAEQALVQMEASEAAAAVVVGRAEFLAGEELLALQQEQAVLVGVEVVQRQLEALMYARVALAALGL